MPPIELSPRQPAPAGPVGPVGPVTMKGRLVQPQPVPQSRASTPPARMSNTRRVIGLILLVAAALLCCMDKATWDNCVDRVRAACLGIISENNNGTAPATAQPAAESAEPTAPDDMLAFWTRVSLVAFCVFIVLLLNASRSIWFVVYVPITAALVALAAMGVLLLVNQPISREKVCVAALAVGYLVQTARVPSRLSLLGMVGLVLVALGAIGAAKGWYGTAWSWVAPKLGPGPVQFVADWKTELAWGLALFLATLGALWSRTRLIHFLNALLLAALAFHCVDSGRTNSPALQATSQAQLVKVAEVGAAAQGAPRDQTPKPEGESLSDVPPWRWVAAVELSVIALVLLYKALGLGAVSLTLVLVGLGSIGLINGWYGAAWSLAAPKAGPGPAQFFAKWWTEPSSEKRSGLSLNFTSG